MSEHDKNQEEKSAMETARDNDDNIEVVEDENGGSAVAESDEQEVQDPEEQITELTDALSKEREKYLRALADVDNMRKRARRDVEDARIMGQMTVLEEMLPSLDSIDMALKSITPNESNQAVYDGMLMVQRQFLSSMERFNLKRLDAIGKKFDPAFHEAVSYVPSPDVEAGAIIDEMRSGYTLGEKLLRASMVVVSSGQPVASTENQENAETANDSDNANDIAEPENDDSERTTGENGEE